MLLQKQEKSARLKAKNPSKAIYRTRLMTIIFYRRLIAGRQQDILDRDVAGCTARRSAEQFVLAAGERLLVGRHVEHYTGTFR